MKQVHVVLVALAVVAVNVTRIDVAHAATSTKVTEASVDSPAAALASPVVGLAATPSGKGYWRVGADGGVLTAGDAHFYGSAAGLTHDTIVAIAATRSGRGYWLTDRQGSVFAFGDAAFHGSMGGRHLNLPVVGMAATPNGSGYWLVASDGGIFSFDAAFHGSTGGMRLNKPIVGMAPTPNGKGYWLVASDGGIFAFDAAFHGSTGAIHLNQPVVGMAAAPAGDGYTMVAADGGLFRFGTRSPFFGSAVDACPGAPAVAVATSRGAVGYWIAFGDARTYAFSPSSHAPTCKRTAQVNVPGPTNTGVRIGSALTPYTGPMTITRCGVVIDTKIISGDLNIAASNGTHSASTPCVTIRNSLVDGTVHDSYAAKGMGPLLLTDTEISVPIPNDGTQIGLNEANFYGWRINVHGGRTDVQCDGYCELHDSWIHGNYYVSPNHLGAFLSNGNYGHPIVLDHNVFECSIVNSARVTSGSGCSADVGLFGDFSPISNVTMTNNLFRASHDMFYFCGYTGAKQLAKPYPFGASLVWTGNVFESGPSGRCGDAGATADWTGGSGNVWSGNTYSNGVAVTP